MSTNYNCADCGREIEGHNIRFIVEKDMFNKNKAKVLCKDCEAKRCTTSGVGIAIAS